MYNDNIISTFKEFKNVGIIQGSNGIGKATDAFCSDNVKLYLKVNEDGVVEDAKFKAYGCVGTLASMTIATDMIKRKPISEIIDIKAEDINAQLGGLPFEKYYCAKLAENAIRSAVEDYYKKIEKQQNNK